MGVKAFSDTSRLWGSNVVEVIPSNGSASGSQAIGKKLKVICGANTSYLADTDGQDKVRLDGGYLAQALKACGGMVDFKLTNAYSPTLFTTDGYQLVVTPLASNASNEQA